MDQASTRAPVVFGFEGTRLNDWEKGFFRDVAPEGYILFARNIETPDQVRALSAELKELDGRDQLPILIDQEGGRVARLRPPHWRAYPPAGDFLSLYETGRRDEARRAVWIASRLIAEELYQLGLTVDCAPVTDLRIDGAHDIVGDRAFGRTPEVVATLAGSACDGFLAGGIQPILKHIPGHGRALADSHLELPDVETAEEELEQTDFEAFRLLKDAAPWAMTAHVLYRSIDAENIATTSKDLIGRIIRKSIGFRGILISDDLSMKAMDGSFAEKTSRALEAGCDLALHCNGVREEMEGVAQGLHPMSGHAAKRLERAWTAVKREEQDIDGLAAELEQLLSNRD
ncbi:beta-N-acetylhexosaminidase [Kiloniella sp. b19]|uniref:beta-N-acetylhexosaminidase n=1 Tax=Kiloniella sp. GXU_MW_B19 TaxID=3141326 RepID=UPI0031D34DED